MAKFEKSDIRDYIINVHRIPTTSNITIAAIPIPVAGRVVGIYVTETVIHDDDCELTFFLGAQALQFTHGILSNVVTILTSGSAIGKSDVAVMDPDHPNNYALEAEGADADAAGGCLRIVSDGVPTTGAVSIAIVIRP